MPRLARPLLFFLQFAVAGLAAAFVIGLLWPGLGARLREGLGFAPRLQPAPVASPSPGASPSGSAG